MSNTSSVPALDKGIDILEFMASTPEGQTLTQIAKHVGRSVSEIQRMVTRLQERAYLVRNPHGAFQLSSKLFRLAHLHPPYRDILTRARPAAEACASQTEETVLISIISDDRLLLIGQVEGRGRVRLSLQVGLYQDPLHAASGRVLLSGWTADDLTSWMNRRSLPKRQREKLLKRLALIRKRGYEDSVSETIEGVHGVAVPVTLPGGHMIAALGTPWVQMRHTAFKQAMLIRHLREAARQVASAYEPTTTANA